jgi:DNA-directed RNA polymerase subunit M/transcription elongation factor TFIIS
MDAQSLIAELATRGIRLIPNPPKLIAVPAAKLTDADCERIRQNKADLLALLAAKHEQAETARICRRCGYHMYDSERVFCPACKTRLNTDKREAVLLDAERRETDRQAKRGYDFDCSAPGHAEYLERTGQSCVCQTSPAEQEERELDRLARADGWIPPSPAHAVLATCRRYDVALRIDADGTLVVGKAGAKARVPSQPWPSLIQAIETHLEAVAQLVATGWYLRADFPERGAA